jgi:uroporphyrin-III C-methyltransferase
MKSSLYLVGAGPGDPELITLKAIKTLQSADVIIYDALANTLLLEYAKPGCIKLFAGKRMGCHYLSQQEINHLIVEYGRSYQNIVRLKGGDPFVFGRAQEEIDVAASAGMQVHIVPGISSCIAAPSSKMIPLTSRGINESFWVTTGTTKSGAISPDIQLAAKSSATVIILMAMSRLEEIMDIFKSAGKSETAVAIIQDATTAKEKFVTGKVKDIFFKAMYEQLSNPAVIVIGEVVNLHSSFIHSQVQINSFAGKAH